MAITLRSGKWQVRLENKRLPRKHFATFLTESEAQNYQAYILSFLERGVVPLDLVEPWQKRSGHKISTLIENFRLSSPGPAKSDLATLARIHE